MKRTLVFSLLLTLAAFAPVGDALAGLEVSAGGGANVPVGDLGDQAGAGFGLGAGIGTAILPMVTAGVDLGYHKVSPDAADTKMSMLRGSGFIQVKPPSVGMSPYLKGMAGFYRTKTSISGAGDDTHTDFGLAGGGGLQVGGAGPIRIFVEGMFHHVLTEGQSSQFVEIRGGVTLGLPPGL